jgi:hypothetical protein
MLLQVDRPTHQARAPLPLRQLRLALLPLALLLQAPLHLTPSVKTKLCCCNYSRDRASTLPPGLFESIFLLHNVPCPRNLAYVERSPSLGRRRRPAADSKRRYRDH